MKLSKWTKHWFARFMDVAQQAELNRLLMRAARRCTRDLAHAIDHIPEEDSAKPLYTERLRAWQAIFWDAEQYRDRLHATIDELEMEVERLRRLLREKGIEAKDPDMPF